VLRGFVDVKMANQPAYRVHTLEVYVENNGQWQMAAINRCGSTTQTRRSDYGTYGTARN